MQMVGATNAFVAKIVLSLSASTGILMFIMPAYCTEQHLYCQAPTILSADNPRRHRYPRRYDNNPLYTLACEHISTQNPGGVV